MKRLAFIICATLGVLTFSSSAQATGITYGGQQPWWNIFCKKNKCLTPEEERLQRFWHDYYHALKCYYGSLDNIDWVAYYKNHGYQINTGCAGPGGCPRVNYAPVFVSPVMQWAVPNSCMGGAPGGGCGPAGCGGGGY